MRDIDPPNANTPRTHTIILTVSEDELTALAAWRGYSKSLALEKLRLSFRLALTEILAAAGFSRAQDSEVN